MFGCCGCDTFVYDFSAMLGMYEVECVIDSRAEIGVWVRL